MTRVLHILPTVDPRAGGPVEGAIRTGEAWASQGHRQDIVTLDPPGSGHQADYPGTIFEIGAPTGRSPWRRYGYAAGAAERLRRLVADYDTVIVGGLWTYASFMARRVLVSGRVPYLVYPHGMLDPWFRRRYPLKTIGKQASWLLSEGPLLRHAAAVLFTTEEERALAQGAFLPYRVIALVVGYGTAAPPDAAHAQRAAFHDRFPDRARRPFLLFMGRLHPKKGCDLLIEGFARAAGNRSDVDLIVAGPDQAILQPALRRLAQKRGIADRVHFTGMLEGDVKWGALRACEAFVLPSHQENFGVAVAEALACAKPVLISDKVAIWRDIAESGSGFVEADTITGTAALIARLLALAADEREIMSRAARTTFAERFEVSASAATLMALIETLRAA